MMFDFAISAGSKQKERKKDSDKQKITYCHVPDLS